jgi:hypothetical protein
MTSTTSMMLHLHQVECLWWVLLQYCFTRSGQTERSKCLNLKFKFRSTSCHILFVWLWSFPLLNLFTVLLINAVRDPPVLNYFQQFSVLFFWVVTPCGLVVRYQCFGETYCLHLQGWSFSGMLVSTYKSRRTSVSSLPWEPQISHFQWLTFATWWITYIFSYSITIPKTDIWVCFRRGF